MAYENMTQYITMKNDLECNVASRLVISYSDVVKKNMYSENEAKKTTVPETPTQHNNGRRQNNCAFSYADVVKNSLRAVEKISRNKDNNGMKSDVSKNSQNKLIRKVFHKGGGTEDISFENKQFNDKLMNICAASIEEIRILKPRSFHTIQPQRCCVLNQSNDYNILVIPVVKNDQCIALIINDRRIPESPKCTIFLPTRENQFSKWDKYDKEILPQILNIHGWRGTKFRAVRHNNCADPELYLLTALKAAIVDENPVSDYAAIVANAREINPLLRHTGKPSKYLLCGFQQKQCSCSAGLMRDNSKKENKPLSYNLAKKRHGINETGESETEQVQAIRADIVLGMQSPKRGTKIRAAPTMEDYKNYCRKPSKRVTKELTPLRGDNDMTFFESATIQDITVMICSHAKAETVIMSEKALIPKAKPRWCCDIRYNDYEVMIVLMTQDSNPVALLVCDRRWNKERATLFAPTNNYKICMETANHALKSHGWKNNVDRIVQRTDVVDVKEHLTKILYTVLIRGKYDESDLEISEVVKFLKHQQHHGDSLRNPDKFCGFNSDECKCLISPDSTSFSRAPKRDIKKENQRSNKRPEWQRTVHVTNCNKKTYTFAENGEKKELYLTSLKRLRTNGTDEEKWLSDDIVHAFCSIVTQSLTSHSIIEPTIMYRTAHNKTYKDENYPMHSGIKYFPICRQFHWVLAIFDFGQDSVTLFDSFQHRNPTTVSGETLEVVKNVWPLYTDRPILNANIKNAPLKQIARQTDQYNCGVLTCVHLVNNILQTNEDLTRFTEQDALEYRIKMKDILRQNFHILDEAKTIDNRTNVTHMAQAPEPTQTLHVENQNIPLPISHTDVTEEKSRKGYRQHENIANKYDSTNVTYLAQSPELSTNMYVTNLTTTHSISPTKVPQKQKSDNEYKEREKNIKIEWSDNSTSSSQEQLDEITPMVQKLSCTTIHDINEINDSTYSTLLYNICANSSKNVVILDPTIMEQPQLIQKCCVYNETKNSYANLIFPIVVNKTLCAILIAKKIEKIGRKRDPRENDQVIVITKTKNEKFNVNHNEKNVLRAILKSHGWNKIDITIKRIDASKENYIAELLRHTKGELDDSTQFEQAQKEETTRNELMKLAKFTEAEKGKLLNGLCSYASGTCGCGLSTTLSTMCSYLTTLQRTVSSSKIVAVFSPQLISTSENISHRNNCAMWHKNANNYDIAFMPIEIENTYGLVEINTKKPKNRTNISAIIYVGLSKNQEPPTIPHRLKKKLKSVFVTHRLPLPTFKMEVIRTSNTIADLCYKALTSVRTNVETRETFLKHWENEEKKLASIRGCAHMNKCPCKLYGDSRGREECALNTKTDLLPNGWTIGSMNKVCKYCGAYLFLSETSATCCQNGKVHVTPEELSQEIPDSMKKFKEMVMNDKELYAKTMLINNNISPGSNVYRQRDIKTPGEKSLVIEGRYSGGICHILNRNADEPAFAQIYLTVAEKLEQYLLGKQPWQTKKTRDYAMAIIEQLKKCNVILQHYMTCGELLSEEEARREKEGIMEPPRLLMNIKDRREDIPDNVLPKEVHKGRINAPAVNNQVAVIWIGDDIPDNENLAKGIRVRERGGQTIAPHFLANLDGLLFVILFPNGEVGYVHDINKYKRRSMNIKKEKKSEKNEDESEEESDLKGDDDLDTDRMERNEQYVSRREFTLFMLARRGKPQDLKFHRILGWGRLSAQWILFSWVRVESDRVSHHTQNQTEIRGIKQSDLFNHLDTELKKRQLKLGALTRCQANEPSTMIWGRKLYQNAMAVAQKCGNPDLFVTFTGNCEWKEIKENLIHDKETWITDPMLCVRVFHEKLRELLYDIRNNEIFGKVKALQYAVEFQKRGMPHAHILITLEQSLKGNIDRVDKIVSAEFPNLPEDENNPTYDSIVQLREKIRKHMIHTPCKGKSNYACRQGCVDNKKCLKKYPCDYSDHTFIAKSGNHIYKRTINKPFPVGKKGKVLATNADVIPHNKFLLSKYDCHINVEVVSSVTAYKYIFKYMYKGPDRLVLELLGDSEESVKEREKRTIIGEDGEPCIELNMPKEHVNTRYVSQSEGSYRLLGYALQGSMHHVKRLNSHLPDEKFIFFGDNQPLPLKEHRSQLESYFNFIQHAENENAAEKHMLWTEVAERYRYDNKTEAYVKRKKTDRVLAYIIMVPPKFTEHYALRLLLLKKAASSFEEVRTINGFTYPTFVEAAVAAGHIHADEEWDRCLALVAQSRMPSEIRRVFASLLLYCKVVNGKELWEKYKEEMRNILPGQTPHAVDQYSLSHIQWILRVQGSCLEQCGMDGLLNEGLLEKQVQYDPDNDVENDIEPSNIEPQMNLKQRAALNEILTAVQRPMGETPRMFFLYGKAGCGKTFTYNRLIAECKAAGKRVIAVASTGIAATLLENGRTAHSTFKIPIDLHEKSVISIDARSKVAERLRKADLIVWDEAPMQSRYAMEAVDRMMRDICEPNRRALPFGGTTIVLGGDWSQFLPVVRPGRGCDLEVETLRVTLKYSKLWPEMKVLTLNENMRILTGEEEHIKWLRLVGEGQCQYKNGMNIDLPDSMYVETEKEIIDWIYTPEVINTPDLLGKVALLSVKNEDTLELNENILQRMKGKKDFVLYSADESADKDNGLFGVTESIEFINSQTPSGMPPHKLKLRIGCIIMLLRNIDASNNLCNGTRLELLDVLEMGNTRILRCRKLNDKTQKECFIQRMPLSYEDDAAFSGLAFTRVQFPVRLSFAMTVNKSQGQTFEKVGLILRTPAFAHGATYVALSRATSEKGIKVTMNRKIKTDSENRVIPVRNIVYKSIINQIEQ